MSSKLNRLAAKLIAKDKVQSVYGCLDDLPADPLPYVSTKFGNGPFSLPPPKNKPLTVTSRYKRPLAQVEPVHQVERIPHAERLADVESFAQIEPNNSKLSNKITSNELENDETSDAPREFRAIKHIKKMRGFDATQHVGESLALGKETAWDDMGSVIEASRKQRAKNQIHYLAQDAAARGQQIERAKAHEKARRADAARQYGW